MVPPFVFWVTVPGFYSYFPGDILDVSDEPVPVERILPGMGLRYVNTVLCRIFNYHLDFQSLTLDKDENKESDYNQDDQLFHVA